jgi:hypothetical protein
MLLWFADQKVVPTADSTLVVAVAGTVPTAPFVACWLVWLCLAFVYSIVSNNGVNSK